MAVSELLKELSCSLCSKYGKITTSRKLAWSKLVKQVLVKS